MLLARKALKFFILEIIGLNYYSGLESMERETKNILICKTLRVRTKFIIKKINRK